MKKILALLLALTLLVSSICLLTACGDKNGDKNNDNNENENNGDDTGAAKVDYTFTLVDQYNNGVAGVEVTFRVGPKDSYTATTDANGVAKINIEETELPVEVRIPAILPAGYSNPGSGKVSFADGAKSAEASLTKLVVHTVLVIDESENAVAGANVQVCVDGVCQVAVDTDAEGKAIFYVSPDAEEAYAQFNTAPEGYNAPANVKIYYVDGATEATFVLTAE